MRKPGLLYSIRRRWQLLVLLFPGVVYYVIFRYWPIYGLSIAFKDYMPLQGILHSPWVGLKYFEKLFTSYDFTRVLANTIIISAYKLVFYFPVPILLALMLNETRHLGVKKVAQTLFYMPHFVSWVIMAGIVSAILSTDGIINTIIKYFGGTPRVFLSEEKSFRSILVLSSIWKEAGWNTVIYLAAITSVNPELYESAAIDGAGIIGRMVHVTLPCIRNTIIITFILRLGSILDVGFEQVLLLYNVSVYSTGDIIDTYVYRMGLTKGQFSLSTAAGLFKSVVGFILVVSSNWFIKRLGEEGLW